MGGKIFNSSQTVNVRDIKLCSFWYISIWKVFEKFHICAIYHFEHQTLQLLMYFCLKGFWKILYFSHLSFLSIKLCNFWYISIWKVFGKFHISAIYHFWASNFATFDIFLFEKFLENFIFLPFIILNIKLCNFWHISIWKVFGKLHIYAIYHFWGASNLSIRHLKIPNNFHTKTW